MNEVVLWLGTDKLLISFEPSDLPREIVKICKVNNHVFALTRDNTIYESTLDCGSENTLVFKSTNIFAIDIACNSKILFFVDNSGQVYKTTPDNLSAKEEIILNDVSKCCSHGYRTLGQKVRVKSIAAEDCSCLYIAENGELWASGDQPKLGLQNETPEKVQFFENRCVLAVGCGANFSVVLAYKPAHLIPEKDDDSDYEKDGNVFVSNCPICVSSLVSPQSGSETCPLGMQLQVNEDCDSTSSKYNTSEGKQSTDNSTSCSSDCKADSKTEILNSKKETSENVETDLSKCSQNSVDHSEVSKTSKAEDVDESEDNIQKEEKRNEFFINAEAARQFVTRQLSWVSNYGNAGEELVECAESSLVRPSQIIKQNVSSVASLVYEGVKTVGDRGATLFRHMSGGSETNDGPGLLAACESFEELSADDFIVHESSITSSFSFGSSERADDSEAGTTEQVAALVHAGGRLLSTELWSWGDISHGQLGTGDTSKRNKPTVIPRLTGIGVYMISCGYEHSLAVSLDGRVFGWGKNNYNQVHLEFKTDQSSPQQINTSSERVKSIAAGDNHSVIITNEDNVYYMGKGSNKELMKMSVPSLLENTSTQKYIFSSRHISGCLTTSYPTSKAVKDLATEQCFLEELLLVHTLLIKPLQKKGCHVQETNVYDTLCTRYGEMLNVICLNVHSLHEYTFQGGSESNISIIQNVEAYVHIYKNYLRAVCDVTALSGFLHIARLIDIPQKMYSVFHESVKKKKNSEAVVSCALLHPLKRLKSYISTIQLLIQNNETKSQSTELRHAVNSRLQDALIRWEQLCEEQQQKTSEADMTRLFWEGSGHVIELLRSPERRLIRESRSHPLTLVNSGRFSSHWFVLFTDILVHVTGGSHTLHPLNTLWVEAVQETDTTQNAIQLVMPEETLVVSAPTPQDKMDWFHCLQKTIKKSLEKDHSHMPPVVRNAKYTFSKHPVYKDAKYTGRWCNGILQGSGKLEWPDGRVYVGQFQSNQMNGLGRLDSPGSSIYEGQWKDGHQNGYGIIKYSNGDIYEGSFKDGVPHGHGVQKQGHFMASVASVYVGEWANGVKQGYGVMDDIATGEKYLGSWSNNMKHGCGLIVTLDGIYYEGVFMQDVLTGHGVMVFEDGTHYEGEFRAAGIFNGRGTLTFNNGDCLEGQLHGAWNEGIKVTGTLHKNMVPPQNNLNSKPSSFGKLCVGASQKWKAIFRHCYQQLSLSEQTNVKGKRTALEVQKAWENIAVVINNSHREMVHNKERSNPSSDHLDTIPQFGRENLDKKSYQELHLYLSRAFESQYHPLGRLLGELTAAYTATYGGVRVHPLLLSHAVAELHSITSRLYEVVQILFPALPSLGQELHLEEDQAEGQESEVVSATSLLHPILLPRVHSALFVLYALHNKEEDDAYWKRLLKWNRQPDRTLMAFLGIDEKFWITTEKKVGCDVPFSPIEAYLFSDAVETLQQLKTTFSPLEKLLVIRNTFQQMTRAVQQELGTSYLWTMDDLFPVFHYVVVRSRILQLGSEIHFIEDFMEPFLQNGELGIMFTTLKACYYQILQEKNNMNS